MVRSLEKIQADKKALAEEEKQAHKKVKRLCKGFGLTAGMLKGSLAEDRKKSTTKIKG